MDKAESVARLIAQCGGDVWRSCEMFPKPDWKYEVENGDTILGYWEWVLSQAEANDVPVSDLK